MPLTDLNFTLQKNTLLSGYVKARCADANHVWNLTGFFTDANRELDENLRGRLGHLDHRADG